MSDPLEHFYNGCCYYEADISISAKCAAEIISKNDNISTASIDDLLYGLLVDGVQIINTQNTAKLSYTDIQNLLDAITKKYILSHKSFNLVWSIIPEKPNKYDVIIGKYNFKWLENLLMAGFQMTNDQNQLLKKYDCSLTNVNIKPIVKKDDIVFIANNPVVTKKPNTISKKLTNNAFMHFLQDGNNFLTIQNTYNSPNNIMVKLIADTKFVLTTKHLHYFLHMANSLPVDNIVQLFLNCNYIFSINDCISLLTHSTTNLYSHQHSTMHNVYTVRNLSATGQVNKMTSNQKHFKMIDILFDFFESKKLNVKQIMEECMFLFGVNFFNYLLIPSNQTSKLKLIDDSVGIKCAILFKNEDLLKYYANKKFIAKDSDMFFAQQMQMYFESIPSNIKQNNFDMISFFVANGSVVTTAVFEVLAFCSNTEKFKHLYFHADADKIKSDMEKYCGAVTNIWKWHKTVSCSSSTSKSEATLIKICKTNSLFDILSHTKYNDLQITNSCYDAILENPYPNVLEYFCFKTGFKPNVMQITMLENSLKRYFLLKRFYPELVKTTLIFDKKEEIKEEINVVKIENNKDDENDLEIEEKPKKVKKVKITKATTTTIKKDTMVDF